MRRNYEKIQKVDICFFWKHSFEKNAFIQDDSISIHKATSNQGENMTPVHREVLITLQIEKENETNEIQNDCEILMREMKNL